ncbi:MAG: ATP-binding cassette domain-containing protein [Actinobacteria bacterium]|nr:ATP-binding cassette domain-containing protein [Actinomycetota bacterium]
MERKKILEIKGLSKYFGGIKAIDNIDMELYEKEIVAIVGDNGAGKSTIIKTISGVYQKTAGEIFIYGNKANINNPSDAKEYGIETVYQDQGLIPILTAASNLFLGREKIRSNILGKLFKFTDDRYMKNETEKLLDQLDVNLKDINAPVYNLSGGQRQTVVVGRAVYWGGKILIFDEPTNNLGVKQERRVLDLIKKLREEFNLSIIVISHNIAHIFELVDRIIVLRNGKIVGEKLKNETNTNEIVSMITGVVVA